MASLKQIAFSKNGVKVFYDPLNSHAAMHFNSNSSLLNLVIEVIEKLDLDGSEVKIETDLARQVGLSDVVEVSSEDKIMYAERVNCHEDGLVPFVLNRQGTPCNYVTIHLIPNGAWYVLSSAWIGRLEGDDEPFPMSPEKSSRSIDYWNKHAFIYGSQDIVHGSETKLCPWV
jgi:hypothetical protein